MCYNKTMKKIVLIFAAFALWASSSRGAVCRVLTVEGVIDPVIAEYVRDGFADADFDIAVIALNTPGGLMDSMQDIVKEMMNCPKPVGVWIGPSGSRAASAGVFITVAADFSAMAPATNIGAAHPVQLAAGGEAKTSADMSKKMVNDAVAYIQSIAKERGRSLEWVKAAVVESVSIGAELAREKGIVDFIAPDIATFLEQVDGREIKKSGKTLKIGTSDIVIRYKNLSSAKNFLHMIANPNIAFILMMIGVWGLIHEASSPGVGFGAAIGSISLLLAFFAMRILPINIVGLLFIILGLVLFFLEIFTPAFGVLTTGGLASLIFGGMMLIDKTKMTIGVSLSAILPTAVFLFLFMTFVVRAIMKSQKKKSSTGIEGMLGAKGEALEDIDLKGTVFVHGEIWTARCAEKIKKGEAVVVVGEEGNLLTVNRDRDGHAR
ncbi:MAG: serine protease [Elusimicrobia bacterium HGW-Elusimicrobia-2]|nr:MAG: serine protease [Elusimicrobia bacterium HGW-Elusimicrobia-2]